MANNSLGLAARKHGEGKRTRTEALRDVKYIDLRCHSNAPSTPLRSLPLLGCRIFRGNYSSTRPPVRTGTLINRQTLELIALRPIRRYLLTRTEAESQSKHCDDEIGEKCRVSARYNAPGKSIWMSMPSGTLTSHWQSVVRDTLPG